jgi:CubicO group peptidase (beta-lactamase class C family)
MKKIEIILFIISIFLISSCQSNTNDKTKSSSKQLENEIESYLKEQIKVHEIPGLAVAVVKNNEVIYKGYFGAENLENNTPVSNLTMFPVYSISKLISATAVFQLIRYCF